MRLIILFFGLILSPTLWASHIVGGEMFYDCLGGNQYRITLKIYRDCNSTGAQYDQNLPVTVFDGNDNQIDLFTISFPGSINLPVDFNNNPCVSVPSNICIQEAIYTKVVTLPSSSNGYTLSYQRCCRGPNVNNLVNPGDQGLTLIIEIPPNSVITCNSSPRFSSFPPLLLCANETLEFDHSATDPDGDSLVYSLCTPYQGGTSFSPAPNPAAAPPYGLVNWGTGFSGTIPFGAGSSISIDPNTGWLTAIPLSPGLYAVAVCVTEYRNGVMISTTRRDFLFRVLDCVIELAADITPQDELITFISFCQGSSIDFENESYGGSSYFWDFGVPGTLTDVSTDFEPTFTFPGPGTYTVTLIVSASIGCSDTATEMFIVEDQLEAFFEPPDPQCIVDNSFNFTGDGIHPAGTSFSWDFGEFATPGNSNNLNPTNIVFTKSGFIKIKFTAISDNCIDTHEEEIFLFAQPTIGFTVEKDKGCLPFAANFINLSFAHTQMVSRWTFGDGSPVDFQFNPSHVYQDSGIYNVSLTVMTDSGCIDTLYLFQPNYIEVFPKPTSLFEVDPLIQEEYSAHFTFTNLADDFTKQWFNFGNGGVTPFEFFEYTYPDPGIYYPYQIVKNQYGCRDTSMKRIEVTPIIPIMVPNAFTPDGDDFNNTFKPVLYKPQNYLMWIYNRWGELVFMSENPDAEWDGTYADGNKCPDDIYIWKIVYFEYDTGLPKEITGHITLLR